MTCITANHRDSAFGNVYLPVRRVIPKSDMGALRHLELSYNVGAEKMVVEPRCARLQPKGKTFRWQNIRARRRIPTNGEFILRRDPASGGVA